MDPCAMGVGAGDKPDPVCSVPRQRVNTGSAGGVRANDQRKGDR